MRWYDQYKELGGYLDLFKGMDAVKRDKMIGDIFSLIKDSDPELISRHVFDFPLEIHRRRWYDQDPYLWLVFNGLKNTDDKLLKKITLLLRDQIKPS